MMGFAALDFKNTQEFSEKITPSADEEELSDLLKFCEKPHSIGLNNVKESLRNVILHMMALMGLDTGYRYLPILDESFAGLSIGGKAEEFRKRKKKRKQLWDDLLQLDRLLNEQFLKLLEHVRKSIQVTKQDIDHKIQVLDRMIETNRNDSFFSVSDLKEAKSELENLKDLKTDIEKIEENLEKTENPMDVISIEKQLDDQLQFFEKNIKKSSQRSPFLNALKRNINKEANIAAFQAISLSTEDLNTDHAPSTENPGVEIISAEAEPSLETSHTTESISTTEIETAPHLDPTSAEFSFESTVDLTAEVSDSSGGDAGGDADDASETAAETHVDVTQSSSGGSSSSGSGDSDATDGESDSEGDDQEDEDDLEPPSLLI